jgi:hypothetical protein
MALSETIYPGDGASASLDFKLVRVARDFRSEQLMTMRSDVELRMHGYHTSELTGGSEGARLDRQRVLRLMADIVERLKALQVPGAAIYHGGVVGSSNRAGEIDLYSGRKIDLTLPFMPSLGDAPGGGGGSGGGPPGAPAGGGKPNLPYAEGSVVVDPKDKTVVTQVQLSYDVPGKPATIKTVSVVFKIDERGELSEVGGELKALGIELKESLARGVITKVGVAAKAELVYKTDKGKVEAKLKAVLSATLNVPGTKLSFDVDVAPYVGTPGKPPEGAPPGSPAPAVGTGISVEFTLFKF